ncbi:hypothetical protein GOV12_04165 [Candidatus Pacearchaeota archaeon]|nr:hypothetical protein [Candidatus Pacearchaeota archaeon]
MKTITIFSIIIAFILFTAATFVYAHQESNSANNPDIDYSEIDEMDEMHNEMIQYIDDPKLLNEMNKMHEACSQSLSEEDYSRNRGNNIMESNNEMNNVRYMMNGIGNMMGGMM